MTCGKEKKYNKEKTIFQNAPDVRLLYVSSLVYSGLIGSGFLAIHVCTSSRSGLFQSWAAALTKFWGKSSLREKRHLRIQVWLCRGIIIGKMPHFGLKCVVKNVFA